MKLQINVHEERIRVLAHQLWEAEGCPEGRSEVHWLQAEERLAKEGAKAPKKRVGKVKAKQN